MDSPSPETLEQLRAENQRLRAQLTAVTAPADSPPLWFDAVSDAIIVTDTSWHIRHWNQAAAQIYGWPQEAVRGQPIAEIIPVVRYPAGESAESARRAITTDGTWGGEVVQHTRDGRTVVLDALVRTFADDQGMITGYIAINRDITERVRTEQALRETERKLGTLFALLPVGISILDAEGSLVYANPALEQILRVDCAGLLHGAHRTRQYIRPDGTPMPVEELARSRVFREQQAVFDVETGIITETGEVIWFSVSAVPVDFPDWRVVMVTTDITARKQVTQALEYERQQLAAIVRTLHEGVVAFHPDGAVALINAAALQLGDMDGVSTPIMLPSVIQSAQMWIFDADGQELGPQDWPQNQVLRGESFAGRELCVRLASGEGQKLWLAVSGTPVYDARGTLILGVITVQDITQRKRDEGIMQAHAEALSRANAELTRALRLKDEFLAMMSHELRTPLTVILGVCEAMEIELYGPIAASQRQALAAVMQSGRQLLAILSDILDLAHIEAGQTTLDPQPMNLDSLALSAIELVQAAAQQKAIDLQHRVAPGVARLSADQRRLTQILVNLLDNAIKFTPEGGAVGLEVRGDRGQERIQFVVWDTGIGIAAAEHDRLFQPFTQVDGRLSRRYGGVGLGLSLVRRLVELHGGSICLESAPGQGSRFTVSLPWAEREHVAAGCGAPAAQPPQPWARPPRVVLADDHEPTLTFYQEMLIRQGAQVTVARTGDEALAQVRAQRPDVAILDIQMPGIDGLEAIRRIRSDPGLAGVPVIALTALTMPGDRERCLAAGASTYLAKPVGLRALAAAITAVLPTTN